MSTDEVAPPDRIAYWEDFNAHTLFGLRCSTLEPSLSLTASRQDVDGLRLRRVSGSPHVIDRTGSSLRTAPSEALYVSILERGRGFFHSPGGTHLLAEGQAVLYGTQDPHVFGFDEPLRLTILEIDAATITDAWGLSLPAGPTVLEPGSSATLRHALGASGTSDAPAAGVVAELARATLNPQGASASALTLRALRLVREHLGDPALTPTTLARLVGISPRHLHRVFAARGTSPAQEIQSQRLEAAREHLLRDPRLSVTEAAVRWGFSGPAHFSRAFARAFGHAPSLARHYT